MKNISRRRQRGQSMVEYASILIIVSIVGIVSLTAIGTNVKSDYNKVSCGLNDYSTSCAVLSVSQITNPVNGSIIDANTCSMSPCYNQNFEITFSNADPNATYGLTIVAETINGVAQPTNNTDCNDGCWVAYGYANYTDGPYSGSSSGYGFFQENWSSPASTQNVTQTIQLFDSNNNPGPTIVVSFQVNPGNCSSVCS